MAANEHQGHRAPSPPPGALWTMYAPAAMTLLLVFVSGAPLLEKKLHETRPGYREYIERTSSFVLWFHRQDRQKP